MLRKLRPHSIYDVMAAIGCFAALATGTAYAANTVFSADIVDGEVKSIDIGQNEIGSADVKDNSLNTFDVHSFIGQDVVDGTLEDQDVGQGTFVDFEADLGSVPANGCTVGTVTGVNAQGDHLLLTPDRTTTNIPLIYSVEYTDEESVEIQVCNPTSSSLSANNVDFNLLVFDAN